MFSVGNNRNNMHSVRFIFNPPNLSLMKLIRRPSAWCLRDLSCKRFGVSLILQNCVWGPGNHASVVFRPNQAIQTHVPTNVSENILITMLLVPPDCSKIVLTLPNYVFGWEAEKVSLRVRFTFSPLKPVWIHQIRVGNATTKFQACETCLWRHPSF